MSFLALLVFTPNCKKETDYTNRLANSSGAFFEKEMIVLGKQLNNPYSVENMQEAYNNLKGNGQTESGSNLNPTHLYIRYLPADDAEYQILKDDQDLELFDYPLDYEMEEGGLSYHDPNLPDSVITWQYTAITINHPIVNVEYEILDSLVIPEFYDEESFTSEFLAQLEREAFRITGNLKDGMFFNHNAEGTWTPQGTIQVYDNIVGNLIPLEGVKVRARSWFKIKTDFTDESGFFQTDQFRNDVNYSIKWETPDYDIRNGRFWKAYYNGPKKTGDWDLDIVNGASKSLRFGTIHRAAHRYHYGDIDGLKRTGKITNLKFKYLDHLNGPAFFGLHQGGYSAINNGSIKIWKGVTSEASIDRIFSTTIHEIAHTSHKKLIGSWIGTDDLIIESWASAVDWHLTKLEYESLGYSNYDIPNGTYDKNNHKQTWDGGTDYSPIFIDLVDDFNQALQAKIKVYNSKGEIHFTPPPTLYCKLGTMDGTGNCYVETAPQGETSHVATYSSGLYASYFYYTPVGCCSCPLSNSFYQNALNYCQVYGSIPLDVVPFVTDTKMYVRPSGTDIYPYDEFTGLTLSYIESYMLGNVTDIDDLRLEVIAHRPSNTHPNVITNLFDLTFYP